MNEINSSVVVPRLVWERVCADLAAIRAHVDKQTSFWADKPMRKKAAAEYLGVSVRKLERMLALGRIRAKRDGRRLFIRPTDLERFLCDNRLPGARRL